MSIKGLELKGGKIVIQEKEKDLRIRKNYSLPQQTITDIEELAKKLNCSASEAIVEAIKVVNALLVEEEPKKTSKKATKKSTKAKEVEQLEEIHDENEVF
nr:hypothetical protein [uncultured Romboutsia sp.]